MKALVLRSDIETAAACASALQDRGFQVACVGSTKTAHAMIRFDGIDLLVMDETVGGRLTHALALSAERRNPYINIMLITDRSAEETDDLYKLIPSLYALVGTQSLPALMAQLAMATTETIEEVRQRVHANLLEDEAEVAEPEISAEALEIAAEKELTPEPEQEAAPELEMAFEAAFEDVPEPVFEAESELEQETRLMPDAEAEEAPQHAPVLEELASAPDPMDVLKDAAAAATSDIGLVLPDLEELAGFNTHVDAYRQIAAMAARPFPTEHNSMAS